MSCEELKIIDASSLPVGKLISMIARGHTIYLNQNLKDYDITAAQLHLMFEISHQKEINQEMIASRCNIDKGAVARSVKKLEANGLVERKVDDNNRRQNIITLTDKGERTLKKAHQKLDEWERYVFDENLIEKEKLQKVLKQMAIKSIEYNEKGE